MADAYLNENELKMDLTQAGNAFSDADRDLMLAVKTGKREVFDRLFLKHEKMMLNYFYTRLWDEQLARDCNQELFLAVWKEKERFRGECKFTTFLFGIAKRILASVIKKKQKEKASFFTPQRSDWAFHVTETDGKGRNSPDRELIRQEDAKRLKRAIVLLPERFRLVFFLSQIEEIQDTKVAEILHISVNTVRTRNYRAMRKLRKILAKLP